MIHSTMLNLNQFLRKAIFYQTLKNNNALEDFQRLTKQSKKITPSAFIDNVLSGTNRLASILLSAFSWDTENNFNRWKNIYAQLLNHPRNSH